jgi:MOSC domain-containing protein
MALREVGRVAALWRYPVKSMLGEQVAALEITPRGAAGDRAWALREIATRQIASAKKFPGLFGFRAAYEEEPSAAHLPRVLIRLPDGAIIHADDAGASGAVAAALGRKVTLEKSDAAHAERAGVDPHTVFGDVPVQSVRPEFTADTLPDTYGLARGTFFDSAAIHVLASGTLRHLTKLAGARSIFDPHRFRPNIYVDTGGGDDRFVEDDWERGVLQVGDAVRIVSMRPALRCVMTTHPQDDLPKDYGVLRTAAQHHRANVGVFAAIGAAGIVRIGDPVYLDA